MQRATSIASNHQASEDEQMDMALLTNQATRREDAIRDLEETYKMLEGVYRRLLAAHRKAQFDVKDGRDAAKVWQKQFEMIREAWTNAKEMVRLLKMDPMRVYAATAAIDFITNDMEQKKGEMATMLDLSDAIERGTNFDTGYMSAEARAKILEWNNATSGLVSAAEQKQIAAATADSSQVLDLDAARPELVTVMPRSHENRFARLLELDDPKVPEPPRVRVGA